MTSGRDRGVIFIKDSDGQLGRENVFLAAESSEGVKDNGTWVRDA